MGHKAIKEALDMFKQNLFNDMIKSNPKLEPLLRPIIDGDINNPESIKESMIRANPNKKDEINAAFSDPEYMQYMKKLNDLGEIF